MQQLPSREEPNLVKQNDIGAAVHRLWGMIQYNLPQIKPIVLKESM